MNRNQLSFSGLRYQNKKKRLRREVFLNEMNQAIPWKELLRALRKHYKEQEAEVSSCGVRWRIARKASRGKVLPETNRAWNRKQSSVRALGEHTFRVVKSLWRYTKGTLSRNSKKHRTDFFTLLTR